MTEIEDYEDIDLDPAAGGPGVTSPLRRPPMPLPGSATHPESKYQLTGTTNSYSTGPGRPTPAQRHQSAMNKSSGKPPLPPPNREYDVIRKAPEVPKRRGSSKTTCPLDPNAPPIPPKPIDFKELEESVSQKGKKTSAEQEYVLDMEELSLEAFVSKYQDDLPLHVRVCKGFYGHSERTSVSEGDKFNIHFIKKSQVVNILDGCGSSYKVALNSALQFGIMYNPNKIREEALAGFKFNKVSEMFQLTVLPKIVRVTEGWKGSSAEATVENNELLILKGLKRRLNHKFLKVVSFVSKAKKELPENCAAKFSTRPYDVRLYLPELMEMVDNPLPTTAVLFVGSDTAHELPPSMVTSVVTLTSLSTETSLIATSTVVEDVKEAPMLDIPYDLDIELQVMWPQRKEDTEQLYSDTRTLLENFKPSQVSTYITNAGGDNSNAQSAVYAIVKEGNEMAGVDLVKPSTIYYNSREVLTGLPGASGEAGNPKCNSSGSGSKRGSSTSSVLSRSRQDKGSATVSVQEDSVFRDDNNVDTALIVALEERVRSLESRLKSVDEAVSHLPNFSKFESDALKVSRDITSARADMKRLEGRVIQSTEDFAAAKKEVTRLVSAVQELREWSGAIQTTISALQMGISSHGNGYTSLRNHGTPSTQHGSSDGQGGVYYSTISEEMCEKNREFLGTLDSMQVLRLLEQMGLKKLQETFMTERVTGEILLECDDEVLYQELKVTSKIHRVRLMKVICGRHSAEGILRGEDPYVYASTVP